MNTKAKRPGNSSQQLSTNGTAPANSLVKAAPSTPALGPTPENDPLKRARFEMEALGNRKENVLAATMKVYLEGDGRNQQVRHMQTTVIKEEDVPDAAIIEAFSFHPSNRPDGISPDQDWRFPVDFAQALNDGMNTYAVSIDGRMLDNMRDTGHVVTGLTRRPAKRHLYRTAQAELDDAESVDPDLVDGAL